MNCPKCSATLLVNAKFCSKCGAAVARQEKAAAPPPKQVQEAVAAPAPTSGPAPTPAEALARPAGVSLESVVASLQGVLRLDTSAIWEVRTNGALTVWAMSIAAAAVVATGLGGFLSYIMGYTDRELFRIGGGLPSDGEFFLKTVVAGSVLGFLLWLAGTGVTTLTLRYLLKEDIHPGEMFRVAGFAAAPLALGFFLFIPGLGFGFGLLSAALLLVFTVLAVHKAFDAPLEKALLAALAGFAVWSLVPPLFVSADNPLGPGVFIFDWSHDWGLDFLGEVEDFLYRLGS